MRYLFIYCLVFNKIPLNEFGRVCLHCIEAFASAISFRGGVGRAGGMGGEGDVE